MAPRPRPIARDRSALRSAELAVAIAEAERDLAGYLEGLLSFRRTAPVSRPRFPGERDHVVCFRPSHRPVIGYCVKCASIRHDARRKGASPMPNTNAEVLKAKNAVALIAKRYHP